MRKGKIFTVFALFLVFVITISCSKKTIDNSELTTVEEIESATETTSETTTIPHYSLDLSYLKLDHSLEGERSRLSEGDQKLYDEWLDKILRLEVFFLPINSEEEENHIYDILTAIDEDYPEVRLFAHVTYANDNEDTLKSYYYYYGWKYIENSSTDEVFYPVFLLEQINSIEQKCSEIISEMPDDLDFSGKYEYLLKRLCYLTKYEDESTTYYDKQGLKHVDISYCYVNGPLVHGKGLCQAYSMAYQLLCQRAGLWCVHVSGHNHRWNLVKLENGLTYHVDPTNCDNNEEEYYNTYYFLLTQEEMDALWGRRDGEWLATGIPLEKEYGEKRF